jgi:Sec7-like guanine-nucleotide exchange factor
MSIQQTILVLNTDLFNDETSKAMSDEYYGTGLAGFLDI